MESATLEVPRTRVVPSPHRVEITPLLFPLVQLALVLLLIQRYHIESRTFFQIATLAVVGFAIHALLPLAHRLPFFVLLSFVGVVVAFGWADGGWLVAIGLALIGICHLPFRLISRLALLVVVGGVLALARAGLVPTPWSISVWPILASMFMFRLAVYLYALEHDRTPVDRYRTLAYFFMLPNVCFPLFPVVDYGTFSRTYYDRPAGEIYQQGVQWIVRGLMHLLLYRLVYQYLSNDPAHIAGLGDLAQFVLTTYLLYLRVSGQFHLIIGMLLLFGFRLPETHRLYYLASSFTDFWRRINIYWKDFMMKLVYYPSFFRLRRWGDRTALVGATLIVFVATWILHSYQWFWLRGGFPITAQDALFWGVLGAFVVANALREVKRGRKRTLTKQQGWNARLALRTTLMFWGMTVLWSLWSAESVGEWLAMWPAAAVVDLKGVVLIAVVTAGFLYAGGRVWDAPATATGRGGFSRDPALVNTALLVTLLALSQPAVHRQFGPGVSSLLTAFRTTTLNARDAAAQQRGYYEQLDNLGRLSGELWQLEERKPEGWMSFSTSAAYRRRGDFLLADIEPNTSINFNGHLLSTNRWGMRDRDYPLAKPPQTTRIALLGPSHVMGYGVGDDETFDVLLEARLNAEPGAPGQRYEVLNFGVGGYSILQQLAMLEGRALAFRPDAVVFTIPPRNLLDDALVSHLLTVVRERIPISSPELRQIVNRAGIAELASDGVPLPTRSLRAIARKVGVDASMPQSEAAARLRESADEILAWTLDRVAQSSRERGAVPILLTLDLVLDRRDGDQFPEDIARRHGMVWVDLLDLFDGRDHAALRVAEWDNHPNVEGNRLIADRLYAAIRGSNGETALHLAGSYAPPHLQERELR